MYVSKKDFQTNFLGPELEFVTCGVELLTLRCLIKEYTRLFNFRNFDTQCIKRNRQIMCAVTCS